MRESWRWALMFLKLGLGEHQKDWRGFLVRDFCGIQKSSFCPACFIVVFLGRIVFSTWLDWFKKNISMADDYEGMTLALSGSSASPYFPNTPNAQRDSYQDHDYI